MLGDGAHQSGQVVLRKPTKDVFGAVAHLLHGLQNSVDALLNQIRLAVAKEPNLVVDGVDDFLQLSGVDDGADSIYRIRAIDHLVAVLQVIRHREVGVAGQDVTLDSEVLDFRHIPQLIVEATADNLVNKAQHLLEREGTLHTHLGLVPLDGGLILKMLLHNLVEQSNRYFLFSLCHLWYPPFYPV